MPKPNSDGWWIPHPGTLEWISCNTFKEAMDKWHEGFNIPRYVEHGEMDGIAEGIERVKRFYEEKRYKII